jgi:cell wall-associated NlpC family hydrolase
MTIELPQWRQTIIDAAASQLNVKYAKDAKLPGCAFDCVQYVAWCYSQALGYDMNVPIQGTPVCFTDTRMTDYIRKYNAQRITLDLALPGDILFFDYSGTSHHSGLVYPNPTDVGEKWMIHSSAAYRAVKAHPLSGEWAEGRRFHSVWSLAHLFESSPAAKRGECTMLST